MEIEVHGLRLKVEYFQAAVGQVGAKAKGWPGVVGISDSPEGAAVALRFAVIDRIDRAVARQRGEDIRAARQESGGSQMELHWATQPA